MKTKVILENGSDVWDSKKRYKVNQCVLFNGISYQNTTGANSSPDLLVDWILVDTTNGRTYKVYTALLTQTGTNAPVATILENTLGSVVWTRESVGAYKGTITGALTLNKTYITIGSNINITDVDSATLNTNDLNLNSFFLNTYDTSTSAFDGVLLNTSIEIRVYN